MPSATIEPQPPRNQSLYAKECVESKPQQSEIVKSTIRTLGLQVHPEGGYFVETDRDTLLVPNPFITSPAYPNASSHDKPRSPTRNAMTTIHYYLTPDTPIGHFHRNKARTVHTLHQGRGRYIIIHPDETDPITNKCKVESFIVGLDIANGEKLQWIVEGGKFKSSFLLPDSDESNESAGGLLISETVVPGFEFCDHDFLTEDGLENLVGPGEKGKDALSWLLLIDEKK